MANSGYKDASWMDSIKAPKMVDAIVDDNCWSYRIDRYGENEFFVLSIFATIPTLNVLFSLYTRFLSVYSVSSVSKFAF